MIISPMSMAAFFVCFFSSVQYSEPLDSTSAKKYRALKELGDVIVIGFSTTLRPRAFEQEARFYLLPWLPTPVLRYPFLYTVGSVLAVRAALRGDPSVLVAQSPYEGFAAALVRSAARLLGKRVALVVESHGDFEAAPFLQRRPSFPSAYRFLVRRLSRFSLNRSDALRAISAATRKQLEAWAPGKPIVQFPTWTDIQPFIEAGTTKKPKTHERVLLYVGVLTPLKAVDVLISAFAGIRDRPLDSRLVLIGRAEDPAYAKRLSEEARALGIASDVQFLGAMPQEDLASHMAGALALVLPSLSEGLGRVVFEAMACGTTVVASRVGGIVELVSDGRTGFLVPPGDVSALAEKLEWVLRHPEKARAMGEEAREFARQFFSAESYVSGYKRLLEQAAESAASTGPRAGDR